ncbi:hypothetical protein SAMN04489730_0136 [Amycolatopsis australiensis]|uniref:Uncharacterized protein n=1 Tax=Amycolatopsis australiensis TaxID=546364 RepID=A0A1K1LQD2_9PSEU|nr:hypothetical protein SAMN04489730_0136 [Amycolatopsis australiensis]
MQPESPEADNADDLPDDCSHGQAEYDVTGKRTYH